MAQATQSNESSVFNPRWLLALDEPELRPSSSGISKRQTRHQARSKSVFDDDESRDTRWSSSRRNTSVRDGIYRVDSKQSISSEDEIFKSTPQQENDRVNPSLSSNWHWEVDSTYLYGSHEESEVSRSYNDDDGRKVRFSPFKQVSFLETNSDSTCSDSSVRENSNLDEERGSKSNTGFSLFDFLWRNNSTSEDSGSQRSLELAPIPAHAIVKERGSSKNFSTAESPTPMGAKTNKYQRTDMIQMHNDGRIWMSRSDITTESSVLEHVAGSFSSNPSECDGNTNTKALSQEYTQLKSDGSVISGPYPSALIEQNTTQSLHSPRNAQSTSQYEYEKGIHKFLSCKEFGMNPRSIVLVETPNRPIIKMHSSKVLILVEASTVSLTDVQARQGIGSLHYPTQLPFTPGVDFVGRVCHVESSSTTANEFALGDSVMSLCKYGGNSRFLSIESNQLVKVPASLDATKAVCLAETYLAAFQALHHGQRDSKRYHDDSLSEKSIFILGSMMTCQGNAIAQLASIAGVNKVYAIAKQKYFPYVQSLGITPLDQDSAEWFDMFRYKFDLIISLGEPIIKRHTKLLKRSGEIVALALKPTYGNGEKSTIFCNRRKAQTISRTTWLDIFQEWDTNLDRCKQDLTHLLNALEKEKFQPYVIDRIPLTKVPKAHELMAFKRCSGFVVCEPWLSKRSKIMSL